MEIDNIEKIDDVYYITLKHGFLGRLIGRKPVVQKFKRQNLVFKDVPNLHVFIRADGHRIVPHCSENRLDFDILVKLNEYDRRF